MNWSSIFIADFEQEITDISKMKRFEKNVNDFQTLFAKRSIIDVLQGSEYAIDWKSCRPEELWPFLEFSTENLFPFHFILLPYNVRSNT